MKRRLLMTDVDGVLTDGTKMYGDNGAVISKRFCDHDFTAIKQLQAHGWLVVWASADRVVNEAVAADRGIPFRNTRKPDATIDKIAVLQELMREHNIELVDVVYVGDDLLDIPIMDYINKGGGVAYCPANAVLRVRNIAKSVTMAHGGYGVLMELYDWYYPKDTTVPCT